MRNRQIKLVESHDETTGDLPAHVAEELHRREMNVARNVMNVLQRQYPGHPWLVTVDAKGKYKAVLIKLPAVMRPRDHYVLPIPTLLNGTIGEFRAMVMRGGGEILERFAIPRSGFTEDPFFAARQLHLRNPGRSILQ